METNECLDLTEWVIGFTQSPHNTIYQLRVSKKVYDEIRLDRFGYVILSKKQWKIIALETEYIGMGEDFHIDIALMVEKSVSTVRDEKIRKILWN